MHSLCELNRHELHTNISPPNSRLQQPKHQATMNNILHMANSAITVAYQISLQKFAENLARKWTETRKNGQRSRIRTFNAWFRKILQSSLYNKLFDTDYCSGDNHMVATTHGIFLRVVEKTTQAFWMNEMEKPRLRTFSNERIQIKWTIWTLVSSNFWQIPHSEFTVVTDGL